MLKPAKTNRFLLACNFWCLYELLDFSPAASFVYDRNLFIRTYYKRFLSFFFFNNVVPGRFKAKIVWSFMTFHSYLFFPATLGSSMWEYALTRWLLCHLVSERCNYVQIILVFWLMPISILLHHEKYNYLELKKKKKQLKRNLVHYTALTFLKKLNMCSLQWVNTCLIQWTEGIKHIFGVFFPLWKKKKRTFCCIEWKIYASSQYSVLMVSLLWNNLVLTRNL